jgi:multiple sugar transport system permease protein
MVSPTTFFLVITTVITSFQLFAEIQVLTQGGPGTASITLVYHIYQTGFQEFKMGYASAVSWVFFLLILVVTVLQWKGQKKWVNYD